MVLLVKHTEITQLFLKCQNWFWTCRLMNKAELTVCVTELFKRREHSHTYLTTVLFKMLCCFSRSAIILNIVLLSFSRVFFCYSVTEALSYFLFSPLFIAFYMWIYLESTVFVCTDDRECYSGCKRWQCIIIIRNCMHSIKIKFTNGNALPTEFKCAAKGHPWHFRWGEYIKRALDIKHQ